MTYRCTRVADSDYNSIQNHLNDYSSKGWTLVSHNFKYRTTGDDIHIFIWSKPPKL